MEQQLKQRLVGAVALVALAVIFLPILFDGAGYRELLNPKIEMPPRPPISYQQQDFIEELKNTVAPTQGDQPIEVPQPLQPKKSQDSVDIKKTLEGNSQSSRPSDDKPTSRLQERVAPASKRAAKPSSGWVVQVGSFSLEANAKVARNKLKSLGLDKVFIEIERPADKDIYVVKIGPAEYAQIGAILEKTKRYYPDAFSKER